MAVFPTSVPTDSDLYIAINTGVTALTAGIDNVTLTIPVVSTTGFPSVGFITIDGEIIKYTSVGPTQFNASQRGADGTAANSHLNGAQVNHFIIAAHHNVHKDEIIAIAQNLSDRIGLGSTQLKTPNGSAAAPSHSFANDTDTGIFGLADNSIRFSMGGTQRFIFDAGQLYAPAGTVGLPAFTFIADSDTGIYNPAGNELSVTVAGTEITRHKAAGLEIRAGVIENRDGTVSLPSYSFSNDVDTGIYRITTDAIGFVTGGTEAFRISNSSFLINGRDLSISRSNSGAEVSAIVTNSSATSPSYARVQAIHNNGTYSANMSLLGYVDGTNLRNMDLEMTGVAVLHGYAQGGVAEMALDINVFNGSALTALKIPKTAEVQFQFGSASLPAIAFQTDADTGLYRTAANSVGVSLGGVLQWEFNANGSIRGQSSSTNLVQTGFGSAATPGYGFTGDEDTGIYRLGANHIGIATNGTLRWQITDVGAFAVLGGANNQILASAGTVSAPAYSFNVSGATDTGIYQTGTGSIRFASDGVNVLSAVGTGLEINIDGSASSPSINWGTDPDTGFYRPTTNALGFVTSGIEQFRLTPAGGLRPITYATSFVDGGFGEAVTQNQSTSVDYGIGGDFVGFVMVQTYNNVNTAHGSKLFWVSSSATELSFTQIAAQGGQSGLITVTNPSGMTLRVALGATGSSGNKVMFMRSNISVG